MRFIHLLPWAFATTVLCAQPTLGENILPTAGSLYGYHDVPYTAPGQAGVGIRWDYNSLPPGTIVAHSWSTADIVPGAGAFPANSLVRHVPGEPIAYFHSTDNAFTWTGTYSDTALIRFDPPLRELLMPSKFGDAWTDTARAAVTGGGRILILNAYHNVKVDGWGTLSMPYGIVNNVVRVRSDLVLVDERYKDWPLRSETRYAWYCDRSPMPLLLTIERSGWAPPDKITRWLDGTWQTDPASLFKPFALRPFPDPCTDFVTVDLPATAAARTILQLIDRSGNIVQQWPQQFTSSESRRIILNVSGLPVGNYTMNWMGSNRVLGSARLSKE